MRTRLHKKLPDRSRRDFIRNSFGGLLLSGIYLGDTFQAKARHDIDHPTVHGMALIGEQTLFLSHLPLFSSPERPSPHNYQVLLEAAFANAKHQTLYLADRKKSRALLYTIEPEEFVLTDLMTTDTQRSRLSSFKATIYRDHFERGGKPILKDARLTIKNVIHFQAFDLSQTRPAQMEYILFGKARELFLAHKIVKPPDFDHLVSVKVSGVKLTDEILQKGLQVRIPTLTNAIASHLQEKQSVDCEIEFLPDPKPNQSPARVTVLKDFYFETGDLAS